MKKNELISIIIASQNRYDELSETLNKIKDQEYKDYEIILVDSSEEDLSLKIQKNFNYVKYIRGIKGNGRINAFNQGLEKASGDIIFTFDDDSFPGIKSISRTMELFKKNKDVGLIGFKILHYSEYIKNYSVLDKDFNTKNIRDNFYWSGCGGAFRKEIVQKLGLWEEWSLITPYELSMCYKTLKLGYRCVSHDNIFVLHHWATPGNPTQRLQQDGKYIYSCTLSYFLFIFKYYPINLKTLLLINQNIIMCLLDFILKKRTTALKAMFHSILNSNKYIKSRIKINRNKFKDLQIPSNYLGK